jgi:hypothetical protein
MTRHSNGTKRRQPVDLQLKEKSRRFEAPASVRVGKKSCQVLDLKARVEFDATAGEGAARKSL